MTAVKKHTSYSAFLRRQAKIYIFITHLVNLAVNEVAEELLLGYKYERLIEMTLCKQSGLNRI